MLLYWLEKDGSYLWDNRVEKIVDVGFESIISRKRDEQLKGAPVVGDEGTEGTSLLLHGSWFRYIFPAVREEKAFPYGNEFLKIIV